MAQPEVGHSIVSVVLRQVDDAVSICEVDVAYCVILTFKESCICRGEKLHLHELNSTCRHGAE